MVKMADWNVSSLIAKYHATFVFGNAKEAVRMIRKLGLLACSEEKGSTYAELFLARVLRNPNIPSSFTETAATYLTARLKMTGITLESLAALNKISKGGEKAILAKAEKNAEKLCTIFRKQQAAKRKSVATTCPIRAAAK